jgi:hypothetical protein
VSARAHRAPPAAETGTSLDAVQRATLGALADHLIPEAHGMPSARDVIDAARLRFVLRARPDLLEPLRMALGEELPGEPGARLAALESSRPDALAALFLVVVGAYYTDKDVRDRLGYPGQQAITLQSWKYPEYMEEGLIEEVVARGPIWRDPSTGRTAVEERPSATGHTARQA